MRCVNITKHKHMIDKCCYEFATLAHFCLVLMCKMIKFVKFQNWFYEPRLSITYSNAFLTVNWNLAMKLNNFDIFFKKRWYFWSVVCSHACVKVLILHAWYSYGSIEVSDQRSWSLTQRWSTSRCLLISLRMTCIDAVIYWIHLTLTRMTRIHLCCNYIEDTYVWCVVYWLTIMNMTIYSRSGGLFIY